MKYYKFRDKEKQRGKYQEGTRQKKGQHGFSMIYALQ